ncbi:MAG: hypothetical protein AB7L28_26915, partial [Kofleriaceae bacterium]
MTQLPREQLIRRVLGSNFLELSLTKIQLEELDSESIVRITVREGDAPVEVEGRGVGMVDAIYSGLLNRYAREYQSLKTIQLTGFKVAADIETKKAQAGLDAVGRVTLDV